MYNENEANAWNDAMHEIKRLEKMLHDMESDFAECARTGKSQCFFCGHDDNCDGRDCQFKWQPHN